MIDAKISLHSIVKLIHIISSILSAIFNTHNANLISFPELLFLNFFHIKMLRPSELFVLLLNLIPDISKCLLLFANLPHNVIHIDVSFLIFWLQLNRLETTQVSKLVLVFEHEHY